MLDIKFIRENPDAVRENIKKKFQDAKLPLVDQVIALDEENRAAMTEANELRASRNALSKQIGSARLSFAEPEFMEQFLNLTPGSVSVLGLMNDKENRVRLLIDRDVLENHPYIGCHPCINTSSLKLPTASLLEKFLPAVHHPYTLVELP